MKNPENVAFPSIAFKIAAWFWRASPLILTYNMISPPRSFSELSDGTFLNFVFITNFLTSSLHDLKERALINEITLAELNSPTITKGEGITCQIDGEQGLALPICLLDFKRSYCGCDGRFNEHSCPYGYTKSGSCRNSKIIKCCVESCKNALDLVFLIDSSLSISQNDFQSEKKFIQQLISSLDIGINQTRVGIINYSYDSHIITDLSETTNKNELLIKINKIPYLEGGTFTSKALDSANKNIFNEAKGMRPLEAGVAKLLILISDGKSDNEKNSILKANNLKERLINIISIGVGGDKLNLFVLKELASSPDNLFLVDDFNAIFKTVRSISNKACQQPAQVQIEKKVIAQVNKDNFKYFKLSLGNKKKGKFNSSIKSITIELRQLRGSADFFYSLDDEYLKSTNDYFSNFNLIEKMKNVNREATNKHGINKTIFFNINNLWPNKSDAIYLVVKGIDQKNEFQIYFHNRTIKNLSSKISNFKLKLILINFTLFYIYLK